MILKQYYLGCLAHASYLIADEETGNAAVVDPQRDIDEYVRDAERQKLRIRHVFLTHFHADFVAGHLELRDRVGAKIHIGARGEAEYAFTPMKDGDTLSLGSVRLTVLETPGHSPESISILVHDLRRDEKKPYAVLTGDTLFIGDVGRPDLRASLGWSAADLGSLLYDSLHKKLLPLPDETLVYPAHGAGSLCGKNLSKDTVSTMGIQRQFNYALAPMTREKFIELVTTDQPDAPEYFTYDAILNTKERSTLEKSLAKSLKPMTLAQALAMRDTGAQIVDVRDVAEFEAAHMAGAVNIGLGGSFATWAGTLLDRGKPIVILAEPGREEEAATRLARIGFDHVAGYIENAMMALETHAELIESTERITALNLSERLKAGDPPAVVDVRTPAEWKANHIAGSLNIPLNRLPERIAEVPKDRPVVITCAGGYRSSVAASILKRAQVGVQDLVGGMSAWEAENLPMVRE